MIRTACFNLVLASAAAGLVPEVSAETIHVPEDYALIQDAIDFAVDGDEIIVAPGTYFETINFLGKAITLRSSEGSEVTIIDATAAYTTAVTCDSGEGPETVLKGFTIENEFSFLNGGGMFNSNSSPTIIDCVFRTTSVHDGGGIYNTNSSPTIIRCVFNKCGAGQGYGATTGRGGAIFNLDSNPVVMDCMFIGCSAGGVPFPGASSGGGIYNANSNPIIISSSFVANWFAEVGVWNGFYCELPPGAIGWGPAVANSVDSSPTLINCTLTASLSRLRCICPFGGAPGCPPDPLTFPGQEPVQGGSPVLVNCILWDFGDGCFDADPQFMRNPSPGPDGDWSTADDDYGDLRLAPGSPCIDAGDNTAVPFDITTDLDGNPRFVDDPDTADTGFGDPPIVDMGAYEFQLPCPWDLNGDREVNVVDLIEVVMSFGPCGGCPADLDDDGFVGVLDLITLIMNFGPCPGTECVWDVNSDGVVDNADVMQVTGAFGPCEGCPEDVNGDGIVNAADVSAVATHFGPCP